MRLDAYVEREGKGSLSRLARDSGLAYSTVFNAARGTLLKEYATAKKLSDATADAGGVPQVSIAELCEPAPASSDSGEHAAVSAEPADGTAPGSAA